MTNHPALVCSIVALLTVGASLLLQGQTNEALARCAASPGASVEECRLVVLGR